MPQPPEKGARPLAQSGLADAVQAALGGSGTLPSLDVHVPRGGTIHLGAEYLAYARQKLSPTALKKELEDRLAPVVATSAGPAPGKPFGKFVVKSFLGKGGMAEVFLAQDPERDAAKGQDVALKVMRDDIAGEPTYIRRFLREAANAGLIDHPNVVTIHEVGAVAGRIYFTMDLVQGQTLKDRLSVGPLIEDEGLEVLRQIAAGLVACHQRGIGHRDLKPSNIMLADPNSKYGFELKDESPLRVKIMDFGLARMYADDDEPEVDAEGRILGTAKYVAPELVEGRQATLQADVFSLGVMAFQIFSGRAPWKAKNKLEYLEANLRAEAPQLSAIAPTVSPETSALVAAMLEKDPDDRPNMLALQHDTERLIARGELRGDGPLLVPDDPESVFYTKKTKKRVGGRSGSRIPAPNRAAIPALVILGVVVVALIGIAVLVSSMGGGKDGGDAPPPPPRGPKPTDKVTARDLKPVVPPTKPDGTAALPPAGSDELVLGKRPRSIAALAQSVTDPIGKLELQKKLESADQAWVDRDPEYARDRWQEALALAGSPPELKRRVTAAEKELALKRAAVAEQEGKLQDALDALDEAEAKGAPAAPLDSARTRLKARLSDEHAVKDAIAEANACVARGEFDVALAKLSGAEPSFARLGRDAERTTRVKEVNDARAKKTATARLDKLVEDARRYLEQNELEPASVALETARSIDANDARIGALAKRLARVKKTPRGSLCLEIDGKRGLYVRREPVSNREYKEWLDAQPAGKRRTAPWVTDFAEDDADKPVKNVKPDDARAFAEARSERLPTKAELEGIARAFATMASGESALDAKGVYGAGFRTVQDPVEERP